MKELRFEPAAREEFLAAVSWYAERSERVAQRFVAAVEGALEEVQSDPESWLAVPHVSEELGARRRLVKKFPYAVVFIVMTEEIRILAVAHGRRRPGYWQTRMAGD